MKRKTKHHNQSSSGSSKKKVLLSLPLVWSVRNYILSGIYHEMAKEYHLILAVPKGVSEYLINLGVRQTDIVEVAAPEKTANQKYLLSILKRAFSIIHPLPGNEIFLLEGTKSRLNIKGRIVSFLIMFFSWIASNGLIFCLMEQFEFWLSQKKIPKHFRTRLADLNLDLAVSTANVSIWEDQLFTTLKSLGVPTVTQILSFDNITSRGWLPIMRNFSIYLVWNERMGSELTKYYQIPANRIVVTGTPQFDFHLKASDSIPGSLLRNKISNNFILYCANHFHLTPREPELVSEIIRMLSKDHVFSSYSFVLRLHPMDNFQRWDQLLGDFSNVVLNLPWQHEQSIPFWAIPSYEDMESFSWLLKNSAAILQIASTIALDASVVNTPVISIGFHPDKGSIEDEKYYKYHFSNHYIPISESAACSFATDMNTLKEQLHEAITWPEKHSSERRILVENICGKVDGLAGERVLHIIKQLTNDSI